MIVKICNIIGEVNDTMITESCYTIIDGDYEDPESACREKDTYKYPEHFIVVKYWK